MILMRKLLLIALLCGALASSPSFAQRGGFPTPSGNYVPGGALLVPKADGSQVGGLPVLVPPTATDPLPVTMGAVPTGGATAANQATTNTDLGPPGATACATDTGSCSLNALIQRVAQRLSSILSAVGSPMQQTGGNVNPDVRGTGTIASATPNAAYSVATNNGEGVVSFAVTGLTASGATLTVEASDDLGTTWASINGIQPNTGILFTTLTTDQQFRVNAGGRTNVRLRTSTTGTGTITVASNASSVSSAVVLSAPLPIATGIANQASADSVSNIVFTAANKKLISLTVKIGATSGYVMLFDASSLPANGAVAPAWCYPVISNGTNGSVSSAWIVPLSFTAGITAGFSTSGCDTLTASATAKFQGQVN